jgi:hypothetical protein
MNKFEKIKSMSISDLSEWLDKNGQFDTAPWTLWFDRNYCSNCESIMCKYEDIKESTDFKPYFSERGIECAYCEIYKKCRYFEDMDDVPDGKDMVKLWLKSEDKE